jgi:hypothetical protein
VALAEDLNELVGQCYDSSALSSLGYEQCDAPSQPSRTALLAWADGNCSSRQVRAVSPGSASITPSRLQIRLRTRALICAD